MKILKKIQHKERYYIILTIFLLLLLVLTLRAAYLQLIESEQLKQYGAVHSIRTVALPALRGKIVDRNGIPLAVSAPLESIWIDPMRFKHEVSVLQPLAELLEIPLEKITTKLEKYQQRRFVYLKRQISPTVANKIKDLELDGLYLQREYRRYYPDADILAQLIGFTNIDDSGQEGIELLYDSWLQGNSGKRKVLQDRYGNIVTELEEVQAAQPGKNLSLSIDRRVQFLLYKALTEAMEEHKAEAASAIILDVNTNEVLAMLSLPSVDPNDRANISYQSFRNRILTDIFEPGSTVKPFTILSALESGLYKPDSIVKETVNSSMKIGRYTIKDIGHKGVLDVSGVIKKSSNVGAATLALAVDSKQLWSVFKRVGFGEKTGSGFPGEENGYLMHHSKWREIRQATIGYGYGLSATVIQLAHAYSVLATDGMNRPIAILKQEQPPQGVQVFDPMLVKQVRLMMEKVVSQEGTAYKASIPGYKIAGKTGTVHKAVNGGYAKRRYLALFAGIVPASNPRFVMVIMVDEPRGKSHYGGQVAAPIFAKVMAPTLRLYGVAPDDLAEDEKILLVNNK